MATVKPHAAGKAAVRYTRPTADLPEFEMIEPTTSPRASNEHHHEPRQAPPLIDYEQPKKSMDYAQSIKSIEYESDKETNKVRPRRPTITIPTKAHTASGSRSKHPVPATLPPPPPPLPTTHREARRAASSPNVPTTTSLSNKQQTKSPQMKSPESRSATSAGTDETPVMRSMFPTYDPTVNLAQQNYVPQIEATPALSRMQTIMSNSSAARPSQPTFAKRVSSLPPDEETAVQDTPLKRADSVKSPPEYSTPESLVGLWTVASGQYSDAASKSYTLELSCDNLTPNAEVITFSTSTSTPFYALTASARNKLSIMRLHPQSHRTKIGICTTTLSRPSRQDPFIASFFPKLAGLLAVESASQIATQRSLDRQGTQLLQADAVKHAQEQESAMLLWDCDSGSYCILHPRLLDDSATTFRIRITPDPSSPARIIVFAPESETPVLDLDVSRLALTIHTDVIAAIPSPYLLDTLVAALLTLLLHLHRLCGSEGARAVSGTAVQHMRSLSNPSPAQSHSHWSYTGSTAHLISPDAATAVDDAAMPYFPPPPASVYSPSGGGGATRKPSMVSMKRTHSVFSTFLHRNHNNAAASSQQTLAEKNADIELGVRESPSDSFSSFGGGGEIVASKARGKKGKKNAEGLVDPDDPTLPKGAGCALRMLYWAFEVLFWVLGLAVRVLSVVVVGGAKLILKL